MKLNKRIITGIMVALITVSLVPVASQACRQGKGGKGCAMKGMQKGMHKGMKGSQLGIWQNSQMVADLGLSDEQVEKLKAADFAAQEQRLAVKAEMDSLHLQMEQAFAADKVDDKAIQALAEKLGAAKSKMITQRVATRLQMKTLLTAEQQDKLKSLRQSKWQGKSGKGSCNKGCQGKNKPCKNGKGQGQGQGQGRGQNQN